MRTGKNARASRRAASPRHGEAYRISRTALARCLDMLGISVRDAARFMKCPKSSVERYLVQGFDIPPLRSRRLRKCFVDQLELVVAKNGKA